MRMLLRADNAARSHDAQPANGVSGAELIVLHQIKRDQRTSPPKPRLTVYRGCSRIVLDQSHKIRYDNRGRNRAVGKIEVDEVNSSCSEYISVVLRSIQSDY